MELSIGPSWASYKEPPLKIEVLIEAVIITVTASVNLFSEAVFITASVNKI
jgi:hypothetical protein